MTPEAIINVVTVVIMIPCVGYVFSRPTIFRKNLWLTCLIMTWFLGILTFLLDALSILFLSPEIGRFTNLMPCYACLALLVGYNYSRKETIYSINLLVAIVLVAIYHVIIFSPDAIIVGVQEGYLGTFTSEFVLGFVFSIYLISAMLILLWGINVRGRAPFEIQHSANIFMGITILLFGGMLSFLVGLAIFPLTIWQPIFTIFSTFLGLVVSLLLIYILYKEPRMLYLLSFSIYRLSAIDHQGRMLFHVDFAKPSPENSEILKELDALEKISQEFIKKGRILDVNSPAGSIIVNQEQAITGVLVASRPSKLLRGALANFTKDFEAEFESLLHASDADPAHYQSAEEFVEKYFNDFPAGTILEKEQEFYLARLNLLDEESKAKLRKVFPENNEYKAISADLERMPKCVFDSVLGVLKDQTGKDDETSDEDDDENEKTNE